MCGFLLFFLSLLTPLSSFIQPGYINQSSILTFYQFVQIWMTCLSQIIFRLRILFLIFGNFQKFKLDLEKARGTRDQIANICWIIKKARLFQKNIYSWFIDYAKVFDCVDHNKLWKILKEMGIPDHLTCSWEICMQVRKQELVLDMEQWTGSKSGKQYIKAVYCQPAYLTYMQSTLCKMLGCINHS